MWKWAWARRHTGSIAPLTHARPVAEIGKMPMTAIADTEHRNYDATVGQAHATKDHERGWGVHAGRDKVCDTGLASCQGRESVNGHYWTHRTPELQRGGRWVCMAMVMDIGLGI